LVLDSLTLIEMSFRLKFSLPLNLSPGVQYIGYGSVFDTVSCIIKGKVEDTSFLDMKRGSLLINHGTFGGRKTLLWIFKTFF
jgi:hypothetical protein